MPPGPDGARGRGERSRALDDGRILVEDRAMTRRYPRAERVANRTIDVSLLGEAGVGKDVMARTIHAVSPRADEPAAWVRRSRAVYHRGMSAAESSTKLGWRIVWGLVGAGLTFTVLSVSGLGLGPPAMVGIAVAAGIAVAIGGPMLLDLLALAT